MNIAEQVRAWQEKISANVNAQAAIMERAAKDGEGRTLLDEEQKEYDRLQSEVDASEATITRLEKLAQNLAKTAAPAGQESAAAAELATAERVTTEKATRRTVRQAPAIVRGIPGDRFAGQSFTRLVIAKAVGVLDGISPIAVAQRRWGKTNPTLVEILRADIEGHTGQTADPGVELVNATVVADFIEFLYSKTAFDQLALREVPANVRINGQDGAATGYWVGEGRSIPVSETSYFTGTLSPLKVAGLAVCSNEWLRDASPSGELLIRDALVEAASQAVDTRFFSATSAGTGSPAGIFNGLSALGSNGSDLDALYADLAELFNYFINAKNAGGTLNFAMSKSLAQKIALMRTELGVKAFPDITREGGTLEGVAVVTGDNIASDTIALVKPSDIYRIGDDGVRVEVSREATIAMSDAPTGEILTPTTESEKVVNMFQAESTAIKVVRSVNFARRRSDGSVAFISDADYGNASHVTD